MEYCGGRSVAQLSKTTVYNGGLLSENVIKYILRETLVALKYLHKNKVIHRDIKGGMMSKGRGEIYGVLGPTFFRKI